MIELRLIYKKLNFNNLIYMFYHFNSLLEKFILVEYLLS